MMKLLRALSLIPICLGVGCSPSSPSSSENGACQTLSETVTTADPRATDLLKAGTYDNCIITSETDQEKINKLRQQGQIEVLKGYMLVATHAYDDEVIKSKILTAKDLDGTLRLLAVLKAIGKFTDADQKRMEDAFPNLQLGEVLRVLQPQTKSP